jgi:predicted phage terminase large subunit-like protein
MVNNRKSILTEHLKNELRKRHFWIFCQFYDPEFFTKRPFLKDVADAFEDVEYKRINSLSVSLPPRAGKSYITSLFCAWTIGRNPDKSVMRNTCTATLFLKFSYDVRSIVKSDKFKHVFTDVHLSDDKSNLQGWNTNQSKQVGYFGAGVGGTIIGFGASNVAITDDLYRGIEDALSDTINDRIIQWKESTHDSRFESGCARIDIGTRWTINDVIGRSIETKDYDRSIMISALDENEKSFCEDVLTSEEYLEKRKKTAKEIWMAEYMQTPMDIEGRLFQLKIISQLEFDSILEANKTEQTPNGYDGSLAYIDVSDQGMDYTAQAIAVIIKNHIFVVDYVFTRDNTDVTIPLCSAKLNKWKSSYCRIESNSMGAMFSRNVQQLTQTKILQVHNTTNKMTRIIMQSAFVMNNMTFVKTGDAHCEQFIQNVLGFSKEGKNKNDDAPDCVSGLSIFVQSMFKNLV